MAHELKVGENSRQIRILIVDGHKVVRQGLRMIIESNTGMEVVGEASNRIEALALAPCRKPDIILLELALDENSGLDFLPELITSSEGARVIVLTGVRDCEVHRKAVRLGAMGVVLKHQGGDVLLRAIERVHDGEAWIDHKMTASLIAGFSSPPRIHGEAAKIESLTKREREIIKVLCEGLKTRQIAEKLFISQSTLRNHLTSILSKLGLSDRFELAIYAYRHGLVPPQNNERA